MSTQNSINLSASRKEIIEAANKEGQKIKWIDPFAEPIEFIGDKNGFKLFNR